jgi:hypothetical protein
MNIELEKAMRGAAERKARDGVKPRDPISGGLHFQAPPATPRFLILAAVLMALLLGGLALSYLAHMPPTHILIIALGLWLVFGWGIRRKQ